MVIGSRALLPKDHTFEEKNGIQLKNKGQIKENRQSITEINTISTLYRCYKLNSWVCTITERLISVLVLMRQLTTTKWLNIHLHEPKGKNMEMQLGREQLCHLGKSPSQSHFCWQLNTHIFKENMAALSAAGGLGASTANEHFPARWSFTGRWVCFYSLDSLYITPTKSGNESVPGLVTKLPTW